MNEQVVNTTITLIKHVQSIYANLHSIVNTFSKRAIETIILTRFSCMLTQHSFYSLRFCWRRYDASDFCVVTVGKAHNSLRNLSRWLQVCDIVRRIIDLKTVRYCCLALSYYHTSNWARCKHAGIYFTLICIAVILVSLAWFDGVAHAYALQFIYLLTQPKVHAGSCRM